MWNKLMSPAPTTAVMPAGMPRKPTMTAPAARMASTEVIEAGDSCSLARICFGARFSPVKVMNSDRNM